MFLMQCKAYAESRRNVNVVNVNYVISIKNKLFFKNKSLYGRHVYQIDKVSCVAFMADGFGLELFHCVADLFVTLVVVHYLLPSLSQA